jgi:hypothetical protein
MIEYVAPVVVASPCVGVCVIDGDGWCEGCGRTLDEIAGWLSMGAAAREIVSAELPTRRRRISAPEAT